MSPLAFSFAAIASIAVFCACSFFKPSGTWTLLVQCLSAATLLMLIAWSPEAAIFRPLDLAIVRIPQELPARPLWRYLRREEAALHPMAIHNRTRAGRLVRIQGRRVEVQYRYDSWLQVPSRRPAMRVDLAPLARWLNRRERHGRWVWENTLELVPRLRLDNGAATSLPTALVLRELRHHLATQPVVWDPYDWPRRRTAP